VTFTGPSLSACSHCFCDLLFLRDEKLFFRSIMLIVPLRYQEEAENILTSSKRLLSRYFIGIVIEILTMMFLLSLALSYWASRML
jgi:predicted PurR-regulated permease PerM